MKNKTLTKTALAVSVILILVWTMLGTASTIAWFSDNDMVVNTFVLGNVKLSVLHKTENGYEPVNESTKIFDDEALYEPGYTQVVYLKVRNDGDVPFDYKLSVIPDKIVIGKNVFGYDINLPDHLKFGLIISDTEEELIEATRDRAEARKYADTKLSNYAKTETDLAPGDEQYAALVICMPESVGNEANYRSDVPSVELGINVKASQIEARGQLG